jgi:chitinase
MPTIRPFGVVLCATLALMITVHIYSQSPIPNGNFKLSIFYCGFSGNYCGQSTTDDVNPAASLVILAFANTVANGGIVVDDAHFPAANVAKWQSSGKKVILSVGGEGGNWNHVFASDASIQTFVTSVSQNIAHYKLDGIDLDIENYNAAPATVAKMINQMRVAINKLGQKLLIVSPEDVAVYQGSPVPDPSKGGQPFNYFVPIIKDAGSSIDYYQPQAYNNWYDGFAGGSLEYLKDVYLNWRNLQGLSPSTKPIPGFSGVPDSKLLIGIPASPQAASSVYYSQPATIQALKNWMVSNGHQPHGFMTWDSHWDTQNNRAISNVIVS